MERSKINDFIIKHKWILLIWGGVCAFLLVLPFQYITGLNHPYMPGWRMERIDVRYLELLENGYFSFNHVSHTLGYPLYFPYLMKIFGITSAEAFHCAYQTWMAAGIILVYPYLLYKCFDSIFIGIISPFVIHFTFADCLYMNKSNEYFTGLWAFVIALPILYLLYKEKREKKIIFLGILLGIIMSIANIMRGQSGAGVFAVSIVLFIMKAWKKEINCLGAIGCIGFMAITYNLLGLTIPDIIGKAWGVGGATLSDTSPWHSLLIGMGYISNSYGLRYQDQAAYDLITSIWPNVVPGTDEYFNCCKEVALDIIKNDTGFVIRGLFAKFIAVVKIWGRYLLGIDKELSEISYIPVGILIGILGIVNLKLKKVKKLLTEYMPLLVIAISLSILYIYPGILVYPYQWHMLAGAVGPGIVLVFIFLIFLKGILEDVRFWKDNAPRKLR